MNITKNQFKSYLDVQQSGVTNMFDIRMVCEISGLSKAQIIYIMENYQDLSLEFKKSI